MRRVLGALDARDWTGLLGLVLLGAGLSFVAVGLALIVTGGLLFAYAVAQPLLERPPPPR